jgi:hypothetical protein
VDAEIGSCAFIPLDELLYEVTTYCGYDCVRSELGGRHAVCILSATYNRLASRSTPN